MRDLWRVIRRDPASANPNYQNPPPTSLPTKYRIPTTCFTYISYVICRVFSSLYLLFLILLIVIIPTISRSAVASIPIMTPSINIDSCQAEIARRILQEYYTVSDVL